MHITGITAAILALGLTTFAASAQNVRDIPAPSETPPASFREAQYVDSHGCVFVRAGVDGRVIWVPRVNAQRKVLCGYPPSLNARGSAPAGSPQPVVAAPEPVVAPVRPQRVEQVAAEPMRVTVTAPAGGFDLGKPVVPKGYKLAWKDDRLNARRGIGTSLGEAQQDLVWSRTTPARLVTRAERARLLEQTSVTDPTRGVAATVPAGRYVQVGSFGEPANAATASARLSALGLPVVLAGAAPAGRQLQVVMAGPFPDKAGMDAALSTLRRAGFRDAIPR